MIKIKNVRIVAVGGSRGIIIPADYFEHSEIDANGVYDLTLEEKKEE